MSSNTLDLVLNDLPRGVCPPSVDCAFGLVDVDTNAGGGRLLWRIVAFTPGRVVAVLAGGRCPEHGPLLIPGFGTWDCQRAVAKAIGIVVDQIASLHMRNARGQKVKIRAVGFESAYPHDIVDTTIRAINAARARSLPFELIAVRGTHVFLTRSRYSGDLSKMERYWRSVIQSRFYFEDEAMKGDAQ